LDNLADVPEEPENPPTKLPDDRVAKILITDTAKVDEIAALKATVKKLELEKTQLEARVKNNTTSRTTSNSDDDIKKLKRQVVTLTQRAQTAEQTRDNLLQKWNNYEQEKVDQFKITELAELAFQSLQTQSTKLSAELEFFKQGGKQQDMTNLKKLQDLNSTLQAKVDELTTELEKERAEKTILVADLRAKLASLESSDRSVSLTQRLANLPSHPKKELSDSRAELAAKDRKIAGLEATLAEIQKQSVLLADQLNRMCDEVEKGEKIYERLEVVSKENTNLKQQNTSLGSEVHSLRDELVQKENEIGTLLDDNDTMVAQLVALGYKVEVGEGSTESLKITPPNAPVSTPSRNITTKSSAPTTDNKKNQPAPNEDLSGLSIDELLNG